MLIFDELDDGVGQQCLLFINIFILIFLQNLIDQDVGTHLLHMIATIMFRDCLKQLIMLNRCHALFMVKHKHL